MYTFILYWAVSCSEYTYSSMPACPVFDHRGPELIPEATREGIAQHRAPTTYTHTGVETQTPGGERLQC